SVQLFLLLFWFCILFVQDWRLKYCLTLQVDISEDSLFSLAKFQDRDPVKKTQQSLCFLFPLFLLKEVLGQTEEVSSKKSESDFFSNSKAVIGVITAGAIVILVVLCVVIAIIFRRVRSRTVILTALNNQSNYDTKSAQATNKGSGIIEVEHFNKPMDFNTITPSDLTVIPCLTFVVYPFHILCFFLNPTGRRATEKGTSMTDSKEDSQYKNQHHLDASTDAIATNANANVYLNVHTTDKDLASQDVSPMLKLTDEHRRSLSKKKGKHEAQSSFFGEEELEYFAENDTAAKQKSFRPPKSVVSEDESTSKHTHSDSDSH
ncbi:hypothetical protein RFI_02635, partial [Reticulomyxa filosa]